MQIPWCYSSQHVVSTKQGKPVRDRFHGENDQGCLWRHELLCCRAGTRGRNENNLTRSSAGAVGSPLIDSRGAPLPEREWVEILRKACTEDLAIHKMSLTELCSYHRQLWKRLEVKGSAERPRVQLFQLFHSWDGRSAPQLHPVRAWRAFIYSWGWLFTRIII